MGRVNVVLIFETTHFPLWTHSIGRQHTSLHVFSASRKNTLGFEMDSKFILRKMIKNIIFKCWKSPYSFWDSVTYKYQPGTAYYRLLPIQTPTLFCIFLFNQSSPSFHKVPHNPGSFPETVHQSLGKTWAINQWWLLNLAKSSTQILLTGSPISYMKTDSKDLINHSLTVFIIQVGRVLDNSFEYKKKNHLVSPKVTLLMLWYQFLNIRKRFDYRIC